jgi:peptidase M28-like protein
MPETPVATERTAAPAPAPQAAASWGLPVALVLLILALVVVYVQQAPPPPKPATAPAAEFSAGRAREVLAHLAGDGRPHPVGSAADAAVRERVIATLRGLGYAPRVETGFSCIPPGNCATVANVVAELPGRAPGDAVLLAAHYDSVGAGPGVSDDLSGVATLLEIARAVKAEAPPKNSVLFLFDEGEEEGLLGARAFEESGPEAGRVKAAVNVEARGTEGPSLMFETGRDNAWLLPLFRVPHPATSSIFITLYQFLPNDTDFTVFERHGITGFNFAFIGGAARYHTAKDDLAHLSAASLQHHGDNALAVTRALAAADLGQPHRGQAVFFDLLGQTVVWWPAGRGLLLAGIALLLVLVAAVRLLAGRRLAVSGLLLGFFAVPIVLVVTTAVAWLVGTLFQFLGPGLRVSWPARALPAVATFWLLALTVTAVLANWLRRARFFGLWTGIWLFWALAGLALAATLPGVSYLFLVPALCAGLLGLVLPAGGAAAALAAVVPAGVAGLVWFPILILLYAGLGTNPGLLAVAALLAIFLTTIVPLVAPAGAGWRWGLPVIAGLLATVMAVGILASPVFSVDSPRRLTFTYHLDGNRGSARFLAQTPPPLPPPVRKAAGFTARPAPAFTWSPFRSFSAPAPAVALPAPELAVLGETQDGGKRHVRLRLTSPRGAATLLLAIPRSAKLESLRIAGQEVAAGRRMPGMTEGERIVSIAAPPAAGIELEAVLGALGHEEWTVMDRSPGLPPAGAALSAARPDQAAPVQDGDATLVTRKVRI